MFPYLDIPGFKARTLMPSADVEYVEEREPGFIEQGIATVSKYINARLRPRYGNALNLGNSLPFGRKPSPLIPAGTNPPDIALTGQPVLGSMQFKITILAGGDLGIATFAWSSDNGATWLPDTPAALLAGAGTGVTTSATYVLGTTGVTANFPIGTYSADNVYASDTQVPEIILGWIAAILTPRIYAKRGYNPQDPQIEDLRAESQRAIDELKEAADSKDGLFDLPANEDADSAITCAGPLFYSEISPYLWMDEQARIGTQEDAQTGYYGRGGVR